MFCRIELVDITEDSYRCNWREVYKERSRKKYDLKNDTLFDGRVYEIDTNTRNTKAG
jgi:hypothetical protein